MQATPFPAGARAPRPPGSPVQFYSTKLPQCRCEELGLLGVEIQTRLSSRQVEDEAGLDVLHRRVHQGLLAEPHLQPLDTAGDGKQVTGG